METLRILNIDESGARPLLFADEDEIVIGRSSRCDVRVPLDSKDISRRHAKLVRKDDGWYLEDIGRSGTYLNEERLVKGIPTRVQSEDTIRVGRYRFLVLKPPGRETMARYHLRVAPGDFADLDPNEVLRSAMELPKRLAEARTEAEIYREACMYLMRALNPAISAVYVVVAHPGEEEKTDILARHAPGRSERPLLSRRVIDAVKAAEESVVFLHEVEPGAALNATVLPSTRAVGACFIEYTSEGAPVVIYMVGEQIIEHGEEMLASYLRLVATLTRQHITTLRRAALTKYFSPNVVQLLMQRGGNAIAQGEPEVAEVTSMFFDLRGFSLSTEASADDLLPLAQELRKVMDIVAEEVFRTRGTIIDYQGDGCFAAWGVPFVQVDQCFSALRCALQVVKRLRETAFAGCGIGVAFGSCLAGSVGSTSQFKYGVLGPSVNVASRLEALTKPDRLNAPILLSEEVALRVAGNSLDIVRVGCFVLAGMRQPVQLYELLTRGRPLCDAAAADRWHAWLDQLESARSAGQLTELAARLQDSGLHDSPRVQWLRRRCAELGLPGGLEGWSGVHHLGEK